MSDKIINTFQQRRRLAQAIEELGATETEQDLLEAVRAIVAEFPADLIAQTLVRYLDTTSSQLRGGLGHLATLLPTEEITPPLRNAVANRQNSPQARVAAALILDSFLGDPPPPALLSDLAGANEVAFQSLREAVDEGRRNRHVLLEYVTQMRRNSVDIAYLVLDLMDRLEEGERVELYRLIAQDDRTPVALEALTRLERLAAADDSALRALHTLQFTLPPDLAHHAQRALRKLQFTGRRYAPPPADSWRALISPTDVGGYQAIWFVFPPEQGSRFGVLLGLTVNARAGVAGSFGSDSIARENLPAPRPIGQMSVVHSDSAEGAVLLEAPFDFARWRLLDALKAHWSEADQPLPAEYRLYNDLIWQFDAPTVAPELKRFFGPQEPGNETPVELTALADHLLAHPVMAGWTQNNPLLVQVGAPFAGFDHTLTPAEIAAFILEGLDRRAQETPAAANILAAIESGLRSQAAWLHIAGVTDHAEAAYVLANATAHLPPSRNPLLARLLEAGIRTAMTPPRQ